MLKLSDSDMLSLAGIMADGEAIAGVSVFDHDRLLRSRTLSLYVVAKSLDRIANSLEENTQTVYG